MAEALLAILATYLVHSTALLGAAWLCESSGLVRAVPARESLWRVALLGAWLTTAVASWPAAAPTAQRAVVASAPAPGIAVPAPAERRSIATTQPAGVHGQLASDTAARATASPKRASYDVPRMAVGWERLLALAFAVATIAGLLRLAFALRHERLRARALEPCADASLAREARELAERLGAPVPTLRYTAGDTGPYATAAADVCLPRWATELDAHERRGMLAHELAHLARRDPAWRIAGAVVARMAWFQPLNRLAEARLDALAELDCDARAARALGDGRPLASCLAACAERMLAPAPRYAAAMSRRRSPLVERIETLLEEPVMQRPVVVYTARVLALTALAAALAALPVVQFRAHAAPAEASDISVQHYSGMFGSETFRMKSDSLGLDARIDGKVTFNAAENDIVSVEEEAWFEQTVGGVRHRIEFENDDGIERRYFVDGKAHELDAAGRAWLAQVIPLVLREGAFDAEKRVARIKASGGAGAVLDETDRIEGDYARRTYLTELADSGPLLPAEVDRAITISGKTESDFEQRTTFVAFIDSQQLAPAQQVTLLEATARIDSDFEQRTVLEALAPKLVLDEAAAAAWVAALDTIESDFEARTVIEAMARNDAIPSSALQLALRNTKQIESDFERRTALAALAPHLARHAALVADYTASTKGIGSDFERRTALVELLESADLDAEGCREVLESVAGIGSDFEQRTVLVELAGVMPSDAALIRRYREIARGMGDHERVQAEKALDHFEL